MKDFLEFIDNKHKEYLQANGIENKNYNLYIPLIPQGIKFVNQFKCLKSYKTRIIYEVGTVRLDFTDYNIIQIISTLDEKVVDQMINDFFEMYNQKFSNFEFEIDSQKYEGKGIDYDKYENFDIELYADVGINMHSFLFVLNMIIFKDIVGQGYYKIKEVNLLKKTLIKYIVLIKYYVLKDKNAQKYLASVNFPYEFELEKIFSNKLDSKKYDRCFDEKTFENIILF